MDAVTHAEPIQPPPGTVAGPARPGQAAALRAARVRLCMTQEILAGAAAVSVRTVIRAEKGEEINAENLRSLCAALGLDASEVAGSPGPEPAADHATDALPDAAGASTEPQARPARSRTAKAAWRMSAFAGALLLALPVVNLATGFAISRGNYAPYLHEMSWVAGTVLARDVDAMLARLSSGPLPGGPEISGGRERLRLDCTPGSAWGWLVGSYDMCWPATMTIDTRVAGLSSVAIAIGPGVDLDLLEAFALQLRHEPGTSVRVALTRDFVTPAPGTFWFDPRGVDANLLPTIQSGRSHMHVVLSRTVTEDKR